MNKLSCALIQVNPEWEDKKRNIQKISGFLNEIKNIDVIILPEMFATGFTMNINGLSEKMDGEIVNWLKTKSQEKNALIIGSVIIKENKNIFNRVICSFPDGNIQFYNKRHLFRMGNENDFYNEGNKKLIINYKDWNICPMICYDLRFPVWSRNINNEYDILVYVANWPEKRREHWNKLLFARAIENQTYVIAVNRIGKDGNGITYSGDSMVIDPKGDVLVNAPNANEEIIYITLNKEYLSNYRKKFPVYLDADKYKLI